jgi:hypothetical protein
MHFVAGNSYTVQAVQGKILSWRGEIFSRDRAVIVSRRKMALPVAGKIRAFSTLKSQRRDATHLISIRDATVVLTP